MASPLSTSLPVVAAADAATPNRAAKPDYDENGADLSFVRYSLSLTPTQRLKAVENFMNAMASVRTAPPNARRAVATEGSAPRAFLDAAGLPRAQLTSVYRGFAAFEVSLEP